MIGRTLLPVAYSTAAGHQHQDITKIGMKMSTKRSTKHSTAQTTM
jgi:hypothetical protein